MAVWLTAGSESVEESAAEGSGCKTEKPAHT